MEVKGKIMIEEYSIQSLLVKAWEKRGISQYQEVREILRQVQSRCKDDDYLYLGRVFHIYMQIELDNDNFEKALEYSRQSIDYYSKSKNENRISHSTRHLADIQSYMNHSVEAESNYEKAIGIYRSNSGTSPLDLANALRGLGLVQVKLNKVEKAIATWTEVRELYQSLNLKEGVDEATKKIEALKNH